MRILAIRGANLASIAREFAIDLAAEPLAGTGLFAITGETGAGKSTILDALCLALYNELPRTADAPGETVPDPSGTGIGVSDPRNILRRGAGSGFAQVDFIGQDNGRYRATWQVRRAREKADSALQNVAWKLESLDDQGVLAASITQTREAIQKKTGFTFEQFRRTVLLAQGDFDAFLLARENERADLLEKITGTEIYTRISRGVYQTTQGLDAVVQQLRQQLTAIGVLSAEDREERESRRRDLLRQAREKVKERETSAQILVRAQRIATAESDLAAAGAALAQAREQQDQAAAQKADLAAYQLVAPLRQALADRDQSRQRALAAREALDRLQEARDRAGSTENAARSVKDGAQAAHEKAEEVFREHGPIWTLAEQLDAQLGQAGAELNTVAAALAGAKAAETAAADALSALDGRIAENRDAATRLQEDLDGRQDQLPLAERLDDARALLDERAERAAARDGAARLKQTATQAATELADLITRLRDGITTLQDRRDQSIALQDEHRRQLAEIDEPAVRRRVTELQALVNLLPAATVATTATLEAAADKAGCDAEWAAATEQAGPAASALSEATAARNQAQMAFDDCARLAGLAEAADSAAALAMRAALADGLPCPVCGSADHPSRNQPDAFHSLVEDIRSRRSAAETALSAASNRVRTAETADANARARLSAAAKSAGQADLALAKAVQAYGSNADRLRQGCAAAGITARLPLKADENCSAALGELTQNLTELIKAQDRLLAAAADHRRQADEAAQAAGGSIAEITAAQARSADLTEQRQQKDLERTEQATIESQAANRLTALDTALAPFLRAAGLSPEQLDRDADGLRRRFEALAAEIKALTGRAATLAAEAQDLQTRFAGTAAARDAAGRDAADKARQHGSRENAVRDLAATRAGLLDGEDTAAHRSRHNQARLDAQAAHHTALAEWQAADAALQAAQSQCRLASDGLNGEQRAAEQAQTAFAAACTKIGQAQDPVEQRLAADPAAIESLRDMLERLRTAVITAEAAAATCRSALAQARDGFDPATDLTLTGQRLAELDSEFADLQQAAGGLQSTLAEDDRKRGQATDITGRIAAEQAVLSVWQEVNGAIGSADGASFRRFVQGITLESLVVLANDHLAAFNPRYRLQRGAGGLTLLVVDRDMGDVLRATRSLSGGERFLASLALALALSGLEGRDSFVDTLFIDEGFGALDAETLDLAVDALETLQGRGRKVGVVTHVAAMIDRIAVQVRVEKRGGGRSEVFLRDGDQLRPAMKTVADSARS